MPASIPAKRASNAAPFFPGGISFTPFPKSLVFQIPPQVWCLDGRFLGSKYLFTLGLWKPREMFQTSKNPFCLSMIATGWSHEAKGRRETAGETDLEGAFGLWRFVLRYAFNRVKLSKVNHQFNHLGWCVECLKYLVLLLQPPQKKESATSVSQYCWWKKSG